MSGNCQYCHKGTAELVHTWELEHPDGSIVIGCYDCLEARSWEYDYATDTGSTWTLARELCDTCRKMSPRHEVSRSELLGNLCDRCQGREDDCREAAASVDVEGYT